MTPHRFHVRTYGCQMNVHDSDKVASLLLHAGMEHTADGDDADLLIINTCSIRDKAENKLYSDLGLLREWKNERSGRILGVGGCVAQQVGDSLLKRFGHLDFVFGTHNVRWVPEMVAGAASGSRAARVGAVGSHDRFDLPQRHPGLEELSPGRAFVTVMEGCDMFCTFCIVPNTRGREISRQADQILQEVADLAGAGVVEVTLLGQTVNAYGRHDRRRGTGDQAGTVGFGNLLREIDRIPGIERIRYTSPHPVFFDEDLIRAHRELEHLCPHVHLPLQSGSDRVLETMRRRYDRATYCDIAQRLRDVRPDITVTTDVIVGFPGETRSEFEETLDVMRRVGFEDSYSFKYSPRPDTKAAEMTGRIAPEEAQDRLEAVQQLQRRLKLDYHRRRVGGRVDVLVEGPSQKGGSQIRGRDPYHRVVNFESDSPRHHTPGTVVRVEIVDATPHSLIGVDLEAPKSAQMLKRGPRSADDLQRRAVRGSEGKQAL
jgi:tRNA-2-methylthio-N6-dimethylallyladenosine synthase